MEEVVQRVLVVDREKKPLMPCHPARAKELLDKGIAAVFRRYPFTIILKQRTGGDVQPVAFKVDPGSKTTGIALVADFKRGKEVVWAAELEHRGQRIHDVLLSRKALRRNRRNRNTRHRAARFLNRTKPKGWLAPSLMSRIFNTTTWLSRLQHFTPISSISLELVKFDTQKMANPEVDGIEYQQGELQGYEVREYLLQKWGRCCAYCGRKDLPLQIEHITPKSRGGSNRIGNLTLACEPCNTTKGTKTAVEFGHPKVQVKAKAPHKDAAAMNATRWKLYESLKASGLPIEVGTGGRTKFNRIKLGLRKAHWIDAACVGESGVNLYVSHMPATRPIYITAMGQGKRQRCRQDVYGFPKWHAKRVKVYDGWRTGDIAKASVPVGKNAGAFVGRVAIRQQPSFRVGRKDNVNPKYLRRIHRSDGYDYCFLEVAVLQAERLVSA